MTLPRMCLLPRPKREKPRRPGWPLGPFTRRAEPMGQAWREPQPWESAPFIETRPSNESDS